MKLELEIDFSNGTNLPDEVAVIKLMDTIKNFGCKFVKIMQDDVDKKKYFKEHLNIKE